MFLGDATSMVIKGANSENKTVLLYIYYVNNSVIFSSIQTVYYQTTLKMHVLPNKFTKTPDKMSSKTFRCTTSVNVMHDDGA